MTIDPESIRETGEWWVDPWWLADNWFQVVPRPAKEVEGAFEYLKQVFDAQWLRSYKGELIENVFLRSILYQRTAFQREYLISLSEQLQRLQNVTGLHVVTSGLRKREESDAASMELNLADVFFVEGYAVEFPVPKPSKGKTPDIRLTKGNDQIVIECKRLMVGKLPAWLDNAYHMASSGIMDAAGAAGLAVKFDFTVQSSEHLLQTRSRGTSPQDAATIVVNRVKEQLEIASRRGLWPIWISLQKWGVGLFYRAKSMSGSSVGRPVAPDGPLFNRLLRNALNPAVEQLRNEGAPGLVAIHGRDIPSEQYLVEEVRRFMNENRVESSHVVAVIILPWQGWFHRNRPFLITNHFSRFNWQNSESAAVLKKRFDPVVY